MMITAPFLGTENLSIRQARLMAIVDWYYGAGSYAVAAGNAGVRALLNALIPVPIAHRETFASWAPKVNFLNDPDLALPYQLFGGTSGLMLDVANTASLFQDAGGTTPVTAAGQPIGRIADLSGGGRHASQAVSSARPTYRIDAGARPYAETDGIDDCLSAAGVPLGSAGRTLIAALRKRSDTVSGAVVETGASWSAAAGGAAIFAPHVGGNASYGSRSMPSAEQSLLGSPLSYPAPHTAVVTATSASGSHVLRVNGAVAASGAPAGPMSALTAAVNIGARNGTQLFASIDLYGLIVADRVFTPIELMRAEKWAAFKCGVTI